MAFLRVFFYIFLYLNIYTTFFGGLRAQKLELSINAEKELSQDLLDSLNAPTIFPDYRSLKNASEKLPAQLQRMGFLEANLDSLKRENDSLFSAHYFFGERTKVIAIYFDESDFSEADLNLVSAKVFGNYFILEMDKLETAMEILNSRKVKSGTPFARIGLREIEKGKDGSLQARLILNRGDKRSIDSLVIKGYEKFPSSFIKYYAGVKKGQVFDKEKLVEQNNSLSSLGFVNSIKPPEALFEENKTTVYFYLEKRNNNLFDGILGFATNEDTGNIEFNGYLNLELNNNLNFGEKLLVNYKADGNDQQNFKAQVHLPYLFKSPFGVGLELKIFKRDSSYVTTEQLARITYQLSPSTTTFAGYKGYDSSNLLDDQLAGNSIMDFKSNYALAGLTFIKPQDDKLFPVKTTLDLQTEIGTRTLTGMSEDQVRVLFDGENIFFLNPSNAIFVRNNTAVLFSETYITNELFRFGGINSIRGFDENSIDASLFSVLNTEYRYRFNAGLYIHSIIDLAYFENQELSLKEKLYSFGLGLGIQTKAGLLKFNIANGNSENQTIDFSNTKIHLSLSSRF